MNQTPPPAGGFGSGPGNGNFGPMNAGMRPPPSTALALAAMVCGILSIPGMFLCYSGVFFGIAGIAMGIVARKRVRANPDIFGGDGLALAGIVCGAIGIALTVASVAFYFAMVYILPH